MSYTPSTEIEFGLSPDKKGFAVIDEGGNALPLQVVKRITAAQLAVYAGRTGEIVEVTDQPGRPQYRWDGVAFSLASPVPASGNRPIIKTGTYVGNAAPRLVDIGFEPDLVIVKGVGQYAVFLARPSWYGNIQSFGHTALSGSDGVPAPSIQPIGFCAVANQAAVNSNGVTYHYVAVKDNGSGILRTFAYNGFRDKTVGAPDNQGATSNAVSMDLLAGTNPGIVYIKRDATGAGHEGVWATPAFAKKDTAVAVDNTLLTLAADGTMALSTNIAVNENNGEIVGEGHNGFSLHSPGVGWELRTYAGTGVPQSVVCGDYVAAAIVIPQAASAVQFWLDGMGAQSADGAQSTLHSGRISGSGATLNIGTDASVNAAGVTYTVVAFHHSPVAEKTNPQVKRPGVRSTVAGGSRVACGTDASLAIAGAHSLEWIGQIADTGGGLEQFLMGRGGNATTGSRGTPVAGSWNYGISYTRDPDAGIEICTSDQFSSEASSASKQKRWRTGIVLRPQEDYHILYTHDGIDKWVLFVNGVPVKWRRLPMSVFGMNGITATAGLTMSFGSRIASNTWAASEQVLTRFGRIYNRALTTAEVAQMYARHYAGVTLNDLSDSATALVEEWKFKECTGTTVAATKNAANNGTVTNGVWVQA